MLRTVWEKDENMLPTKEDVRIPCILWDNGSIIDVTKGRNLNISIDRMLHGLTKNMCTQLFVCTEDF